MSLTLKSGFSFDYDNLVGEGKVTKADVEALSDKIKAATEAIKVMRKDGIIRGHLSKDGTPEKVYFSQLPYVEEGHLNNPASMAHLQELTDSVRNRVDAVVSLGIGGSYLGDKVIFDVQCGEFWNSMSTEERDGLPQIYFSGQNIDPRRTGDIIRQLARSAKVCLSHKKRKFVVSLMVISKSGGTLDTMSNFMVIYDALQKTEGINMKVVAVTDPNVEKPTLLKKLAMDKGWPQYSVPDGVGGRFSVFCEVGLSLAAAIGFDIEAFLKGARDMDEACKTDDIWQNPALLNSVLKFLAGKNHGRDLEVLMPYADNLKSLSEWYIQLLAESLGKRLDKQGNVVNYGRTPIVAVGTTDMHAQTQEHQEGPQDKVVQFVSVENWPDDVTVPHLYDEYPKLAAFSGLPLSQILEAARSSNAEALAGDGRPSANYILPALTPYHLGELMFMLCLSIAYEGEYANVDAFNQPGVEVYKKFLGGRLKKLQEK